MIKTLMTIMLICVACQGQETELELELETELTEQPLRVGIIPVYPPLEFLQDGSTNPVGFDVDFFAAVAAVAGYDYEYVDISGWSPSDLFAIDLINSGVTITEARKQIGDFSVPYYVSIHEILAREGTDITSAEDLASKVVAVVGGTTGDAAVQKIFGGDSPNILRLMTPDQALQALINGQADALVDDNYFIQYSMDHNPGLVVIKDPDAFEKHLYGLVFPKGSDLISLFNEAITVVLENGEYTAIYNKWFGTDPDVDLLLAAGKYEDPYDVFNENQEEMANEECYEAELLLWDQL